MIKRKACIADVPQIQKLINQYADQGMMLAKPLVTLYEHLREYTVLEQEQMIVAVGGLHILWSDLAEVRSLAVHKDYLKQGLGAQIVSSLCEEAQNLGLPHVFALTYQTEFFLKQGFSEIEHRELPQKVWMDCINCPKFPDCDEHAVLRTLTTDE